MWVSLWTEYKWNRGPDAPRRSWTSIQWTHWDVSFVAAGRKPPLAVFKAGREGRNLRLIDSQVINPDSTFKWSLTDIILNKTRPALVALQEKSFIVFRYLPEGDVMTGCCWLFRGMYFPSSLWANQNEHALGLVHSIYKDLKWETQVESSGTYKGWRTAAHRNLENTLYVLWCWIGSITWFILETLQLIPKVHLIAQWMPQPELSTIVRS